MQRDRISERRRKVSVSKPTVGLKQEVNFNKIKFNLRVHLQRLIVKYSEMFSGFPSLLLVRYVPSLGETVEICVVT